MQATAEFKLDFVGGWTKPRYVAAQSSLEEFVRRYPLVLPRVTMLERRVEATRLWTELEKFGLISDILKLSALGVRKRTMLAVVEQADIDKLGLVGTLEQYRTVFEPELDECECPSPDCDPREICPDELLVRVACVKELQDMVEEERLDREERECNELREQRDQPASQAKKVRGEKVGLVGLKIYLSRFSSEVYISDGSVMAHPGHALARAAVVAVSRGRAREARRVRVDARRHALARGVQDGSCSRRSRRTWSGPNTSEFS